MIPWVHLASAQAPEGGELKLMQRGHEYSIMLGGNELMGTRLSGSEEALARLCAERIGERPGARLLIGGLGMGFTLRAALACLAPDAKITVAELVPAVVEWARGPLASVFDGCLHDPRVTVFAGDVGDLIRGHPLAWDAIALDVDNGPEGLTRPANDGLYSPAGLGAAKHALTPGGVLAVWSSAPSERFAGRLAKAGFAVEEKRVRAGRTGRGARHVIWLAARVA
jgi:spermidine synthase